jgi:CRP/FNR family transcriptional regulator, cyclic AMP receptor protein
VTASAEGSLGGTLSALAPDQAAVLMRLGKPERFPAGTVLFAEGSQSGKVALILSGTVKVSSERWTGEEVVLSMLRPGDVLGELAALDGKPHSATATVVETSDVLMIPADDFRAYVEAHPKMALLLLKILGDRLRDADRKRCEFGVEETVSEPLNGSPQSSPIA